MLHGGAPMELPWADQAGAILCMYLGGERVGEAAVKLLIGEENPCGKLAESWPLRLEDNPSYLNFPGVDGQAARFFCTFATSAIRRFWAWGILMSSLSAPSVS